MLSDRDRQVDRLGRDERCLGEAHKAPAGHHEFVQCAGLVDPAGVEHEEEGCPLQFHNGIIFQFANFANKGCPGKRWLTVVFASDTKRTFESRPGPTDP